MKSLRFKALLLGLVTLLIFPILSFISLHFLENYSFDDFLSINTFNTISVGFGLELGFIYAFIIIIILDTPYFRSIPNPIPKVIQEMKLKPIDAMFLSICAGVGEEFLFRMGLQHYVHWIITSVFFIALHGYFNLRNLKKSLYGIIILPFVLIISLGFYYFGIWFCIAAHFMYDYVILISIIKGYDSIT